MLLLNKSACKSQCFLHVSNGKYMYMYYHNYVYFLKNDESIKALTRNI